MNFKNEVNLKIESSVSNHLINSPVILAGRCTSTPKDSTQLLLNDLKPSFDLKTEKPVANLNSLNSVIDFAPIPIFGRRNLQLLNNYVNNGVNQLSKEDVGLLLRNAENIDEYLAKPNVKNELLDKVKPLNEDNSASITHQLEQEIKKSNNKQTNPSYKILESAKVGALKKTNYSTTKRSNHSENKLSSVKVNPKYPKSPKLLTAIRARLRQNCELTRKEKAGNTLKFPFSSDKKTHERISKKNGNSEIVLNRAKFRTLSTGIGTNTKKYQIEFHKKQQMEINKISKLKQVKSNIKPQKDDTRKPILFKAQPIRKYSPLPSVKKRSITIPQSPKLGKRRYLN